MFKQLADKVKDNFSQMIKDGKPIFLVNFDKDKMWEAYLNGFSNEDIRQSYNCNNCKSFFRRYAGIVGLNEKLEYITMFDKTSVVIALDSEMANDGMAQSIENVIKYIRSCKLETIPVFDFDPKETLGGVENNTSQSGINWSHFNIHIPEKYVAKGSDSGASQRGKFTSKVTTLNRCLKEIKQSDTELLIELIDQGSIYKGVEFRPQLSAFLTVQKEYNKNNENLNYAYLASLNLSESVTNIRNTSIGTLLVDIAEGTDLDIAVKKYEKVVAPTNYKRPTALVTGKMIDEAKKELEKLGLIESLNRKYATRTDVSANDLLHTYNSTSDVSSSVFDDLKNEELINPKVLKKVEEVSIEDFINKVLPSATRVQALFENRHQGNLVSLITAQDLNEKGLFKWDNGFSWSYTGGITDSLREKVANLGGRVDGVFRFSHSWNELERNQSLMDLHVFMPGNSHSHSTNQHDGYGTGRRVGWNNRKDHQSGGNQDVDYVNEAPKDYIPVENITFPDINKMPEGKYICKIHNWSYRKSGGRGKAEIEFGGNIYQYEYPATKNKEWITIAEVTLKNGEFTIEHKLDSGNKVTSKKVWGLDTYKLHDVTDIMLSPNYWGENKVGNKHYIFALANCISEEKPRPFFNEFLRQDLDKHRKVFEVLGSKVQILDDPNQLSGLGFSETLRNDIILKVKSKFERYIKVKF